MNFKKLMSLFMAVLMLFGVMASLSVIPAAADDVAEDEESSVEEVTSVDALYTEVYASPEEKLATMKLMTTKGNYSIYALESSGEVAVKDLSTGQILFTNPYDIGAATASESVKNEILSQIIVKFDENGRERVYSSFEYAALRDQIKVKNIKNGIRVEYTIGREEARRLVPRMIRKDRFEEMIQAPMEEYYGVTFEDAQIFRYEKNHPLASASFYLCKQMSYFVYKDLDECTSDRLKQDLLDAFPIVEKMDIYVLDKAATTTEIEKIEEVIKTACPNYSYEEMDYDHQITEYTGDEENPPVFKMALEYTLGEDGFTVRLPANGIRFNESKFQLTNVSVLPYMGAGNNTYNGYTFYPDGSGALFSFEDLADQNTYTVASKIYGVDYAYHQISGTYQQTVRYPVFGIVENTDYYDCLYLNEEEGIEEIVRISSMVYEAVQKALENGQTTALTTKYGGIVADSEAEKVTVDRGYVAIIEEGDALTELVTYHAGVLSPYDTVQMNFNPRPKDSYNIADAISVGTNSEWTVVSNRKYVGNYKIHYVMLSDESVAAKNELSANDWYEASWLGMAKAYRDYLVGQGVLSQLTNTSSDIPLYIEAFGAVETIEKFASIPVEVMRPLTSTEDIKTMYEELSSAGATNINFKLTGFANGGVYYSTMPYKLKWEKAVQEGMSMQELFDYAKQEGDLTLFPEFEFSYQVTSGMFDGFSSRKHAVRTIDDRYTFERPYMATQQKYSSSFRLAVSPAYYDHFYTKLMENYLGYNNVNGISVGSLGDALNSDFDEDEPYNREDSKGFVAKALEYISGSKDDMEVMVEGGNAYTWKYVNHILGAALDSSRYIKASYSVPFVGVVLHGYMNFAGAPLNMEGDVNYAKLKAIENGASVYFTLSYQNTQILKDDRNLSQYYSIRYDIWYDDVVEIYNELNNATKDVQDKIIVDHQFLSGMRVPDVNELDRDTDEILAAIRDFLSNKAKYEEERKTQAVADARDQIASLESTAQTFVKDFLAYYVGGKDGRNPAAETYMGLSYNTSFAARYAAYIEAKESYEMILEKYQAADDAGKAELAQIVANAESAERAALVSLRSMIRSIGYGINQIQTRATVLQELKEAALAGRELIYGTEGCPQSILDEIDIQIANANALMDEMMGITFNLTVDKGEVDTVLRTHIATLFLTAYGSSNHAGVGIVGKAENLYKILKENNYGLRLDEVDLLRYLEANKGKTDEQLIDEYDLTADGSDIDGLIKFVRELLNNDQYKFDPVISSDPNTGSFANGVDKHIHDYIRDSVYTALAYQGAKLVPTLNFAAKYPNEEGLLVSNTINNQNVMKEIDTAIDAVIFNTTTGFATVTDGEYDLYALFTEEEIDKLVKDCVAIIKKNIRSEENPVAIDKSIDYVTPETMEADVLAYIESKFYKKVLDTMFPAPSKDPTFEILGTVDKTSNSIALLLDRYAAAYKAQVTAVTNENSKVYYATYLNILRNDAALNAALNAMNGLVSDTYGDSRQALEYAFIKALVASDKTFLKNYSEASHINSPNPDTTVTGQVVREAANSFVQNRLPAVTLNGINALADDANVTLREAIKLLVTDCLSVVTLSNIDQLVAAAQSFYHEVYGINHAVCQENGYDVALTEYIYHRFFSYMKTAEVVDLYYDNELAYVDVVVANKVVEMNASLQNKLTGEYNIYDILDVVLNELASHENSVYNFTKPLAGNVSHVPEGKHEIEDDILAIYIYELINSFEGYELSATEPTLPLAFYEVVDKNGEKTGEIKQDTKKYADLIEALEKRLTEKDYVNKLVDASRENISRGALTNYAVSALKTIDMDAIVADMYDALLDTRKVTDAEKATAETVLLPALEDYIAHKYYMVALRRLGADVKPEFHVSEVYSDNLAETTSNLESLMIHFVMANTDMTEDEIRALYSRGDDNADDEELDDETSRYLSDDGRIVSVTYGDKNADGSYSAYKTFILNYNNFSVSVDYVDGVTYTIPAYGYVVVWPNR